MNLLALLFALACERGLTHWLRLREARWLDHYCDRSRGWLAQARGPMLQVGVVLVVVFPALPVLLLSRALGSELLRLPQFTLAVFVLLFSFGPRDLKDEVDDYLAALERRDGEAVARHARALREGDVERHVHGARSAVEEAIFVQANNRIFGVIFWFMLGGSFGAWLYRVSDLLRRRAAFEAARSGATAAPDTFSGALAAVHGVLAWAPARLTALSYALAGSFEDALGNWKGAVDGARRGALDRSEDLLARVGCGSLQPSLAGVAPDGLELATARGGMRIVERALWIWLVVVALLVLAGSAV